MFSSDAGSQQHVPKGKVGAAILGNRDTRKYQLLVYVNNTTHLTKANVDSKFAFTVWMTVLRFRALLSPHIPLFLSLTDPTQPLCCLL